MPIDRKRYSQFRQELLDLAKRLRPDEYYATVRAKLLDYMARNQVDPHDPALQRIVKQIFGEEFAPFVGRVMAAYAETLDVVNEHYKDLGVDVSRDFQRIRAIEYANAQELGEYEESAAQHITKHVRESLIAHETARELQDRLIEAGGKVKAYARTIAQTQVKVVGRAAKAEKARIAEVEFFEYVGLTRDTNRAFCRALIGTTHSIASIREMKNGNKEPVLYNCGGWRCIHDWEPDPFAKEGTKGKFYVVEAQSMKLKVRGDENTKKRIESAEHESHFRDLADPEAFIEKCRTVELTDARKRHILRDHPENFTDASDVETRVREARSNPDAVYFQFHRGESTVVFEKDQFVLSATLKEVKTMYQPKPWPIFQENVVKYWKKIGN